ncbi:T9SS type A sorting domain-containing protein [Chryseobacterium lacus]|uniref:T9SS C-terminal target domain-containing protein n=1 Tax=Chryseobacterium lacus TaxID=2058346 RepID=A0A368MWF2_9FLAO|nr:T9SS type A sorting domain-containing protein [Chryseobacterium lacus]RCU42542.1 T9SS C-terminal target domain-containing protein [Chryseobacterium lacus]RST27103.1 T9SS type A sorting domain-containing protein [Chryseobacterium lacus]
MKNNLLFCMALACCSSFVQAQLLESDNYESYTLGSIATATNGTTVGQGGMYLYNGAATDYQIVAGDATHGKYLQVITGSDGTAASSRYVFKTDNIDTGWANRTAGNNIIKGSFDLYTGTSTNKHNSGMSIFGATAGIVGIRYNSQTKTITGLANILPTGGTADFYIITGLTPDTFPANTWIKLGFSYNKTTGAITYSINGVSQTLTVTGAGPVSGLDPEELDVYSNPTRLNATDPVNVGPTTFGIDNYRVEASDNSTLATTDVIVKNTESLIAIGPNPTVDYLNILTAQKINKVEVHDLGGRKMNVFVEGNRINVERLSAGSYLITIHTNKGITSEIFIKK